MFDLKLKRKYINDNWYQYLNRVITPNTRTQTHIKQIVKNNNFIYCLSERHHDLDTFEKKIKRMLRMRDGYIDTEQYLSVYQILIGNNGSSNK